MTNSNSVSSVAAAKPQRTDEASRVLARVEKFPVATPKFTKESWGSGEGG